MFLFRSAYPVAEHDLGRNGRRFSRSCWEEQRFSSRGPFLILSLPIVYYYSDLWHYFSTDFLCLYLILFISRN